ncbi:MAG: hypothetical protein H0W73_13765 [Bacteroidetes bacterium]|nr:hypothetical protein [Bacteroidota bacterium]
MDISPGFRTLFILFTGYSLFSKFNKLAKEKKYDGKIPLGLCFLFYTALVLAARLQDIPVIISFLSLFSFVFLIPALRTMNFYYLKEQLDHSIKKRMGTDEKIFLLVVWVIALFIFFNVNEK